MLHKRRRCLRTENGGTACFFFAVVAGIGTGIILQNSDRLGNHKHFSSDKLLANHAEIAAAFTADPLAFRQFQKNFFHRQICNLFFQRFLFLPCVGSNRKGFLSGLCCLGILFRFCFVEQCQLILAQYIFALFAGLAYLAKL